MDLRQLNYFVEVYKCKSYTKAAANLFISQQGLSLSLKRLENELNAKLLVRTDQGYIPTTEGVYLYKKANEILCLIKQCDDYFGVTISSDKILVVACVIGLIGYFPDYFSVFMNDSDGYPKVKLIEGTCNQCEKLLLDGDADMAFLPGPVRLESFRTTPLFDVPHYLIVNKKNPLSALREIDIPQLEELKLVNVNKEFRLYTLIRDKCMHAGFRPHIVLEMDRISDIFMLVNENPELVGVGNEMAVRVYLQDNLACIPINDNDLRWSIHLVQKENAFHTSAMTRFRSQAQNYFKDIPGRSI